MATSTLMKFSLLAIIVIISSYISSTEAQSPCAIADGASSSQIMSAVNCTITRCEVVSSGCGGPNCFKLGILITFVRTVIYPLCQSHVGTCSTCPPSTIISIRALLLLLIRLFVLLAGFLSAVLKTLAAILVIVGILLNLLAALIAALGVSVTALALGGACNTLCINAINVMMTSYP